MRREKKFNSKGYMKIMTMKTAKLTVLAESYFVQAEYHVAHKNNY